MSILPQFKESAIMQEQCTTNPNTDFRLNVTLILLCAIEVNMHLAKYNNPCSFCEWNSNESFLPSNRSSEKKMAESVSILTWYLLWCSTIWVMISSQPPYLLIGDLLYYAHICSSLSKQFCTAIPHLSSHLILVSKLSASPSPLFLESGLMHSPVPLPLLFSFFF